MKRPLTIIALLFSVVVLASACGSSNDPTTWAEAEEDGNLRPNFIRACTEANVDGGDEEGSREPCAPHRQCPMLAGANMCSESGVKGSVIPVDGHQREFGASAAGIGRRRLRNPAPG